MSAMTMSNEYCVEKPAELATNSKLVATPVAEPAKETKMETTATLPAGVPFGEKLGALARSILPPVLGLLVLIGIWHVATHKGGSIPGPAQVWDAAVVLFSDPFYRNGPNDQGIGWNVLASLQRVGIGFGFAALVGIPLGFMIGRFEFLSKMLNPIISLLRPVSPLAWLPIGLLVFKKADPAATWTIFICSIWPMIMNTAQGVQRVPQDYLNVARVLALSEWKVVTKILFPAVLPYMLTGIRLSIGTAWLAIVVIGIVGLILEQALILLARKLTKESA